MQTISILVTGGAGPGITAAATALALHAAGSGRRTLLLSFGPSHSIGALLEAEVGNTPVEVVPRLDALALDAATELSSAWQTGRGRLPGQLQGISGDELPLLPGLEMLFGSQRLQELAEQYEVVVADAGPHDALLRILSLPDSLRWGIRLLFGLDRGPGRSSASVGRAVLPTGFLPIDTRDGVQDFRLEVEQGRDRLVDPQRTVAYYVLRPDAAGLAEARLAVPALQLHGLAVPTLLAGPLLPADVSDTRLLPLAVREAAVLEEARQIWHSRTVVPFPLHDPTTPRAALANIGTALELNLTATAAAPIRYQADNAPAVVVDLPGMPRGALQLTVSGDELIVRVGPYRRHILLPDGLRGVSSIRATREDDQLIVRKRE